MRSDNDLSSSEKDVKSHRQKKEENLAYLEDHKDNYDVDKFMSDLTIYFDGEVDFDLKKIRETVDKDGELDRLIKEAKEKNTHPVIVFIQELFKDLTTKES